jgi:DNA primase catalytic core
VRPHVRQGAWSNEGECALPRIDYEKLLQNVSIEDVAQRLGMMLKKTGANQAKTLCPFHDDKTPSLLIDSNRDHGRQHYYCFACGAHGDSIDLVKQQLGFGFKEAVDWLVPGSTRSTKSTRGSAQKTGARIVDSLSSHSGLELGYKLYKKVKSRSAFDAWLSERHLDAVTLRRAGFIHAPRNFLSRYLDSETDSSARREHAGYLEDAYLIRKLTPGASQERHLPFDADSRAINRYSDFFLGERVIFPIYDEHKKLLGLAGRSIENSISATTPKYQFTRGFPKATVLYRAEYAFEQIRSEARNNKKEVSLYLCEGFLDALRFETLGIPAVAVMGSSISEHQVKLLQGLSDSLEKEVSLRVIIGFDKDEAGLRGAADACLKLMNAAVDCAFLWPTTLQLAEAGREQAEAKDPNDYLQNLSSDDAREFIKRAIYSPELAVLANAYSVSAEDVLNGNMWASSARARRVRAFKRALTQVKKAVGAQAESLIGNVNSTRGVISDIAALNEWKSFISDYQLDAQRLMSDEYLNNTAARLNHSRILAYMGSRRGELPCDEPRWERLDIAATAFNALLTDRLQSTQSKAPIGPYNAVWVPRSFGGAEYRLKMMPRPEDLIIQQYLLNEILTERWDDKTYTGTPFSQAIPAVRYYREDHKTITTGFDSKGDGRSEELSARTLSFAYQIDMDVLEGRQPATDQGMYRPFHECWRDFMRSITKQASEIGYVYSVRLDVKRYYDCLRRYVVRDRLQVKLQSAIESVIDETPGFAELLNFELSRPSAAQKASAVLDLLDEHLFGVSYSRPDTGGDDESDSLMGIPQGPVLSAWVGSIALFPVDEEANRFMERLNADRQRVGYARYVDDIVLLADDPTTLAEMREAIDRCTRRLELTLLAKADEIPPMSAEDFVSYINQGRALAAYGPAWEPPLVGDGDSGWEFWSVTPSTDRQSALQLLHNVELYKASQLTLIQTVRTAFQAPDLRTSELSKASRLIWYSIAVGDSLVEGFEKTRGIWSRYNHVWSECVEGAAWHLQPEKNAWESPILFALEGLEHLIDKEARDIAVLSAEENVLRRSRIAWLAEKVLNPEFYSQASSSAQAPAHQLKVRLDLVLWKAARVLGRKTSSNRISIERSRPVQIWHPFEWMHGAVSLLSDADQFFHDPLLPYIGPTVDQTRRQAMSGLPADIFKALLPDNQEQDATVSEDIQQIISPIALRIALQTIASIVPREQLPICLSRRHRLAWKMQSEATSNRLTLPPLPGITTTKLLSCLVEKAAEAEIVTVHGFEAIDFASSQEVLPNLFFCGSDGKNSAPSLEVEWLITPIEFTNGALQRLESSLDAERYFNLRENIISARGELTSADLKLAAKLFRSIAQLVIAYSEHYVGRELVPAWPYIATSVDSKYHYIIADGVCRDELGNRAFVRDGGRALRTIEVPIYEASLWRVGVAISDYLGLFDDITKFSGADSDLNLDAVALANPARYVLRSQLRKLRGVYANSQISKRRDDVSSLPTTVERSLRLLEGYPAPSNNTLDPLLSVLASEAESAGMYLALREPWECTDIASFLRVLTGRVLSRLPLSIAEALATSDNEGVGLRRDFLGLLCVSKRLFTVQTGSAVTELPAWKAFCAGAVSAGIYAALDGLIASLRSHGSFERYETFDFPSDWGVPLESSLGVAQSTLEESASSNYQCVPLLEVLRRLVQHLGHRMNRDEKSPGHLSEEVYKLLQEITQSVSSINSDLGDNENLLEWPFQLLSGKSLELLNFEMLENVAHLVKMIDQELGFEVVWVVESSYGYNPQTRRFTDSRNGVRDVTPWMISQFPKGAKVIEEVTRDNRFLRVWSEVFDRKSGQLLSVSVLGEPFASIAISRSGLSSPPERNLASSASTEILNPAKDQKNTLGTPKSINESLVESALAEPTIKSDSSNSFGNRIALGADSTAKVAETVIESPPKDDLFSKNATQRAASAFQKQQVINWALRGESFKPKGHVRVALLQADFDLTYKHPFVEACPASWPFAPKTIDAVSKHLKSELAELRIYESISNAVDASDTAHLWSGLDGSTVNLPSWSEHRRQSILKRVIDTCQTFGVDLLVLPEYSVRRETIDWLKIYLANKTVSVLAGTYMNVEQLPAENYLAAPLTLLWPLPKQVSNQFSNSLKSQGLGAEKDHDAFKRGYVLEFSRHKKYRSIALEEFFRPSYRELGPLFNPRDLAKALEKQTGFLPSVDVISHLLANTPLPLKHLLELICSEIFLVSSPANYRHMADDLRNMSQKFGETIEGFDKVFGDVRLLSEYLSITGDGIAPRRSILAVPAATSRSADYWIAGQAGFLAAGTATIFCNSIDGKTLVGGSCFIGCNSWKSEDGPTGYISKITPYHGWTKGIFYNNKDDALSKFDQAVVIADIDPYNMLEGRPRAQTMPAPLQLVAYLPLVESVDWPKTEANLLESLSMPETVKPSDPAEKVKSRAQDEEMFWATVDKAKTALDEKSLDALWKAFPDTSSLSGRAKAYHNNGDMQPMSAPGVMGLLAAPALYDWINVSLTLSEQQQLPKIAVPPWKANRS